MTKVFVKSTKYFVKPRIGVPRPVWTANGQTGSYSESKGSLGRSGLMTVINQA